jgi:hypothetical protein
MIKNVKYIFFAAITISAVLFLLYFLFVKSNEESNRTIESTIVLEKIESVSKLVTTEGYYSNIYKIEDYYWFDFAPFKKSIIIRVKLKALVGVDLSKINIVPDELNKTFYIENVPGVEPIAIDQSVEYYDVDEGMFNGFNKDDLNEINRAIRSLTEKAIMGTDVGPKSSMDSLIRLNYSEELNGFFIPLVDNAKKEAKRQIGLIDYIANISGWKVVYK